MTVQLQTNPTASADIEGIRKKSDARVSFDLHTDAAYRLVIGRPASVDIPHILGLFGFADLLRSIWDAARNSDPYARWWLLKVETCLAKTETVISTECESVQHMLAAQTSFRIDADKGGVSRSIDLLFACPYAYHGARLVKQFDSLIGKFDVALQLGARRISDTKKAQRRCERAVRRIFSSAQGYRDFGLTQAAVERSEATAIDAEMTMGRLPTEVLNGNQWPMLLDRNEPDATSGNGRGQS